MSLPNPFNTLQTFSANGASHSFYSLPALEAAGFRVSRLPVSIRLVLESLLRNCDGKRVAEGAVRELANWGAKAPRTEEIPFVVARIVLQDFTGVPLLVDLAAMRSAVARMGRDPKIIEPLVPVDLVVDHSVQVDFAGSADAMQRNLELEFSRNRERYQFLKWGMQAFDTFKVVPPGIGIVHQVNLEYLAKGVLTDAQGVCYPDTLVGTDSHTTMINGIGIVGWGVGGIEAEAGMLGQPVYFLTPDVVGVHLTGALREGVTATDLALTLTQLLRKAKVVGKFVEFYGPGAQALPVVDRATIANMAPEYGATMGFFPIDGECSAYLRATGREESQVALYEAYYRAQGLWGMPQPGDIDYSSDLSLDLSSVVPSVAGPKRPQDRIELPNLQREFFGAYQRPVTENGFGKPRAGFEEEVRVTTAAGRKARLTNGSVVIAAITSCTNTSNPSVMLAAGLLAKKAVERGLKVNPAVKASLAPGSRDAATLVTLPPGSYTIQVAGVGTGTAASGVALVEVYEADATPSTLVNLSCRARVGTGGDILIAGFVIRGTAPRRLLIRGVGPTLAGFGVAGTLADPKLEIIRQGETSPLATNDNWSSPVSPLTSSAAELTAAFTSVGAFALTATSRDAALIVTLPPGTYTAQVSGLNNTVGVAIVEVYDLP
jgi:aconitate hydratase